MGHPYGTVWCPHVWKICRTPVKGRVSSTGSEREPVPVRLPALVTVISIHVPLIRYSAVRPYRLNPRLHTWPWHGTGGWSPIPHHGGHTSPREICGRQGGTWMSFSFNIFSCRLSVSFHQCPILILHSPTRRPYINIAVESVADWKTSTYNCQHLFVWGAQWCCWLRHCATDRNVAGSIPHIVIVIFGWRNSLRPHYDPGGLTQPLTENRSRGYLLKEGGG